MGRTVLKYSFLILLLLTGQKSYSDTKILLNWQCQDWEDIANCKIYYDSLSRFQKDSVYHPYSGVWYVTQRGGYANVINVGRVLRYELEYESDMVYCAVTACDSAGNESEYSNEINSGDAELLGDFNGDGIVNFWDLNYMIWECIPGQLLEADFIIDGIINFWDLNYFVWFLLGKARQD